LGEKKKFAVLAAGKNRDFETKGVDLSPPGGTPPTNGKGFGYGFVVPPNRIFPLGEFFKNSDNLPLRLWCMENYSKLNSKLTFARVYLFRIPSARRAD